MKRMSDKDKAFDYWSWEWPSGSINPPLTFHDVMEELERKTGNLMSTQDQDLDTEYDTRVGDPLRGKFSDLVVDYPYGVSVYRFLSTFKETHGYYPEYTSFGYSSVEVWCRALRDVFDVKVSPLGETLLFPAQNRVSLTALELFRKTWEQIRSLLIFNGCILKVVDIPGKLLVCFNVDIDPYDWHLGDEMAFYHFCLSKWPSDSTEPIFLENVANDPSTKLLVQRNPCFPKTLEFDKTREEMKKLEQVKKDAVAKDLYDRRITWKEYVRSGDELPYMIDELKAMKYYRCITGAVYTPGHFYVIPAYNWNRLEEMMEEMQQAYRDLELSKGQIFPIPETLVVGLYVAAKRKVDQQWHRAMITNKSDNHTFEVFNIDYGDINVVDIKDIRYLKTELLEQQSAQAVRCVAKLGRSYNGKIPGYDKFDGGFGWNTNEGTIFRKTLGNNDIAIKCISKIRIPDLHVPVCQVFVHILEDSSHIVKIGGLHIERQVMKLSRHRYMTDVEEKTDTYADVKVVSPQEFLGLPDLV